MLRAPSPPGRRSASRGRRISRAARRARRKSCRKQRRRCGGSYLHLPTPQPPPAAPARARPARRAAPRPTTRPRRQMQPWLRREGAQRSAGRLTLSRQVATARLQAGRGAARAWALELRAVRRPAASAAREARWGGVDSRTGIEDTWHGAAGPPGAARGGPAAASWQPRHSSHAPRPARVFCRSAAPFALRKRTAAKASKASSCAFQSPWLPPPPRCLGRCPRPLGAVMRARRPSPRRCGRRRARAACPAAAQRALRRPLRAARRVPRALRRRGPTSSTSGAPRARLARPPAL